MLLGCSDRVPLETIDKLDFVESRLVLMLNFETRGLSVFLNSNRFLIGLACGVEELASSKNLLTDLILEMTAESFGDRGASLDGTMQSVSSGGKLESVEIKRIFLNLA